MGDEAAAAQTPRCPAPCLRPPARRFWTLSEEVEEEWQPVASPLPSDCRHREDLALLAAGDLASSQRAKELLENAQRRDKKLRTEALGSH